MSIIEGEKVRQTGSLGLASHVRLCRQEKNDHLHSDSVGSCTADDPIVLILRLLFLPLPRLVVNHPALRQAASTISKKVLVRESERVPVVGVYWGANHLCDPPS